MTVIKFSVLLRLKIAGRGQQALTFVDGLAGTGFFRETPSFDCSFFLVCVVYFS